MASYALRSIQNKVSTYSFVTFQGVFKWNVPDVSESNGVPQRFICFCFVREEPIFPPEGHINKSEHKSKIVCMDFLRYVCCSAIFFTIDKR